MNPFGRNSSAVKKSFDEPVEEDIDMSQEASCDIDDDDSHKPYGGQSKSFAQMQKTNMEYASIGHYKNDYGKQIN